MHTLFQDFRYGTRMLLKNPGFALVAIITLALGIGANTAIFSVVNAVLLRPLPYRQPERLVKVLSLDTKRGATNTSLSFLNFIDYRAQNDVFEALTAFQTNTAALTGDSTPERITGLASSPDLFTVLGVQAALGRTLIADDEQPNPSVVVLSHSLWQRRYNSDVTIIGRQLTLNGRQQTVIGVLPASFQFPFDNGSLDYFVPLDPKGGMEVQRGAETYEVIGRLKPGVTIAQAEAEMRTIAARLELQYPKENAGQSTALVSAHEDLVGDVRGTLLMLLGAVGLVLLIACANVANLQLARAAQRSREIAIRVTLGASRWRIVKQLLIESLLLAVLGGALGLFFAVWGMDTLSAFVPPEIPRFKESGIDFVVFGITLLASVLTGILFGLAPALQASKINLNESLKEGGRSASEGKTRHRLRSLLIVTEVALSLMLLVGAGLLIKSFIHLRNTNPGFNTENVLTASITLPSAKYPKDEQLMRFYQQFVENTAQLPEVEAVGAILPLPYSENAINVTFKVEGALDPDTGADPIAGARIITPDYPRAMGIPLISGRVFTESDTAEAPKVILINETLQRRYFSGQNPIGKRLHLGLNSIDGEIVGVIGDVRDRHLDKEAGSEFYVPYQQIPVNTMSVVVRAKISDPTNLTAELRAVLQEQDKDLPLYRVRPMSALIANSITRQRFTMTLLVVFAALALALAGAGIFSVMSFLVAQRTPEIGIRLALGAQRRDVHKLVIGQGMLMVVIGVTAGLAGAMALTRLLKIWLFGVGATDPATFAVVTLLLAGVALVACYLPARRATKVDPLVALRNE